MRRYHMIALTKALPGREDELRRWYEEYHLQDILAVPGVVSGIRCDVSMVKGLGGSAPEWDVLALYELEADDPATIVEEITRRRQAGMFTWSDAILGEATLQIVAAPA